MQKTLTALAAAILVCGTSFAGDGKIRRYKNPVAHEYIALVKTLEEPLDDVIAAVKAAHGVRVLEKFRHSTTGFAFEGTQGQAEAVSRDARVIVVEQNSTLQPAAVNWGLDRLDDRPQSPLLDQTYESCETGAGVFVYVLDTGVWADHPEFSNLSISTGRKRVEAGWEPLWAAGATTVNASSQPCGLTDSPSANGPHGTMVGTVIAGQSIGVAPNTTLRPVAAANCNGAMDSRVMLRGLEWIKRPCTDPEALDAFGQPNPRMCDTLFAAYPYSPRIVNISYVNSTDPNSTDYNATASFPVNVGLVEDALRTMVSNGFAVVVAAGNQSQPVAETYYPARLPEVLTVGSTRYDSVNDRDAYAAHSNYGAKLDLFAPGENVRVGTFGSFGSYRDHSGTSFASAYVSGVAARWVSGGGSPLTGASLQNAIVNDATSASYYLNWQIHGMPDTASPQCLVYKHRGCSRPRIVSTSPSP